VNPGAGAPTALIVDDDVAFILWLGEMFTESGYQAFPALLCSEALNLARKMDLCVDVLVVNPKLRGATRTMELLGRVQPGLRVVLIRDPADCGLSEASQHPAIERPAAGEPISRPQWIMKIRRVLMKSSTAR
jgi:ActR/RegA family two-component response regulator